MPQRTFLGYDSPFLPLLTSHLLADREGLASTLVITPTTQSGRILRESLAAEATALLAPTVTTPGALLHLDDPAVAPAWLEKIAWIETLASLKESDWENLTGLFPLLRRYPIAHLIGPSLSPAKSPPSAPLFKITFTIFSPPRNF